MLLVTRDPTVCPQCKMLKMKLEGAKTVEYETQDADTADGMATMAYYEIDSVPCLITGDDAVILGIDNIYAELTSD